VRPGRAADQSPSSSFTCTHPLDHNGLVTGSLYLYNCFMLLSLFRYGRTIVRGGRNGHLLHGYMHVTDICGYRQTQHDAEIFTSKCAFYISSISHVIFSEILLILSAVEICRLV